MISNKNVIRDGYTAEGFILGVPGLYSDLRFKYRPMLPEHVEATEDAANRKANKIESVHLIATAVAAHVTEWSEVDDQGTTLPPKQDNVRRLPFALFNKLYRVVAGIMPSDPIPGASQAESSDYIAELMRTMESEKTAGEVTAERDAKN